MLVTYLRSSSYNAWEMCQAQYAYEYVLGIKAPSGQKADKGNIVHKALEILAHKKLALQEGRETFREEETGREFAVSVDPDEALEAAWECQTRKASHHDWRERDRRDCSEWLWNTLLYNDGMFSPLKRTIVAPEQYFDITIDRPWASYEYFLPDGQRTTGKLAIRGTVDLVTEVAAGPPRVLEYIDWKTGARLDWATGQEKSYEKLLWDAQLRMYHYALCHLYPEVETIMMTIFFCRDGGPFTLCYHRSDLSRTEEMIRRRFEAIRNTARPARRRTWRCSAFCWFGKNPHPESGKTMCEHLHGEIVQLGLDRVALQHGNSTAALQYGSGGGRSSRDLPTTET
jgi:hypothetical protein